MGESAELPLCVLDKAAQVGHHALVAFWKRRRHPETSRPQELMANVEPSDPDLPDISLLLVPEGTGTILFYGAAKAPLTDTWTITIPVAPFSADDIIDPTTFRAGADGPVLVETSYQLDFIDLASARSLDELEGRSFDFPVSPATGFIDGSIYVCTAHNPADAVRIAFGKVVDDTIEARIRVRVNFDFEGTEAQDFDATLDVLLQEKYVPVA